MILYYSDKIDLHKFLLRETIIRKEATLERREEEEEEEEEDISEEEDNEDKLLISNTDERKGALSRFKEDNNLINKSDDYSKDTDILIILIKPSIEHELSADKDDNNEDPVSEQEEDPFDAEDEDEDEDEDNNIL